jgi:hypothetical protein
MGSILWASFKNASLMHRRKREGRKKGKKKKKTVHMGRSKLFHFNPKDK